MTTKTMRSKVRDAADHAAHSASADKAKGRVKETVGKMKAKIGSALGNEELEVEGEAQRLDGKTDRIKGEIKEKLEDAKSYVKAGAGLVAEKLHTARHSQP